MWCRVQDWTRSRSLAYKPSKGACGMVRFQTWRNGPGCLSQCLGGNARKLGLAKIDDKDLLHQLHHSPLILGRWRLLVFPPMISQDSNSPLLWAVSIFPEVTILRLPLRRPQKWEPIICSLASTPLAKSPEVAFERLGNVGPSKRMVWFGSGNLPKHFSLSQADPQDFFLPRNLQRDDKGMFIDISSPLFFFRYSTWVRRFEALMIVTNDDRPHHGKHKHCRHGPRSCLSHRDRFSKHRDHELDWVFSTQCAS